ncbi:MAG TPA: hypothetical protein VFF03_19930 [Rhodocyclaceae bacterium]|nr:hypothetical protein [Rhodocyclaceae bacterium]
MDNQRKRRRPKDIQEPCPIPYFPIPQRVMDSPAYTGATSNAIRLLLDLLRQHNGFNNGHLQASWSYLSKHRGWTSASRVKEAIDELLERKLLIRTRRGGRSLGQIDYANPPPGEGPAFYALTWLPISNFKGLEITGKDFWPGSWDLSDVPPRTKKIRGRAGAGRVSRASGQSPNGP